MFATIFFERDPLKLADFPSSFQAFVIYGGSLTAILLAFWLLLTSRDSKRRILADMPPWMRLLCKLVLVVGVVAYAVLGCMYLLEKTAAGTGPHRRTMFRIFDIS